MLGLELRMSDVESYRSANCATTAAYIFLLGIFYSGLFLFGFFMVSISWSGDTIFVPN